ncbi:TCR/Tet family MFS transporter [Maribacter arcticus]|jgi:DHA1 family tetracycline resistance protein-like MFS transporter|uniref:MFS transporter, DHA1 family, tetracycline resistance protein n=2 Tax=Maribacter arcticus TaxID=561365 RepID=A0A1T5BWI2_9FLAO|nr:TCR/Tet family MFS transporter [Maribacter arcticus]SKB51494.1 MFS transporter, DHA1 family, tetracycline resistance protein [Maribacter arcticus]|tara:strand:+ start:971 stop:2191 length:1221 start_codon:yes stop_codon:yes gene_type:complete
MKSKKTALLFIFITILVDVIGIGIILPIIPDLIMELTGEGNHMAIIYGMWLTTAFAGMQFLFSPVLGEISDKFGRRPILLLALFGLSIDYMIHAWAPTIAWLFLGRFLAGITGASFTVASAYIADVSTKENKAKNFGLIGAAFGVGFIIGPGIGGFFGEIDIRLPFYIAAGLTFANFLFGYFFVPESLAPENRRQINYIKMIPGVSLVALRNYKGLLLLISAFFLANLAGQALPSTWSYYGIERYDWNPRQIGISLMVVGLLVAIVQGFLVGVLVKKFGKRKIIIYGFLLWTVGMFLFSFAKEPWMLYAFLIPYALGGIAGPTVQGVISNQVSEKEQGILQGSITGLVSVTAILGQLIFSPVFYYFIRPEGTIYFPGAPYALAALFLLAAFILAFTAIKRMNVEPE